MSSVSALESRPVISLELAKKMSNACEAKAKQEGWKMNIAIVNTGGQLIYFVHQDDSFLKSIEISQMKATTSASLPFSAFQAPQLNRMAFVPKQALMQLNPS